MQTTTIGILGGGQLGQMLALAGIPLGMRFRFLEPAADAPMAPLAQAIAAPYDDAAGLRKLASGADVVTYEFENVALEAARSLAQQVALYPPPAALEAAQDRLTEKQFFQRIGAKLPAFLPIDTRDDLNAALKQIGVPAVLKTRRMGYDGKGQFLINGYAEAEQAWQTIGQQPAVLEAFVPFERELSIIAVRGRDGATACYPLIENLHQGGILRRSVAPAPAIDDALQAQAESIAVRALDALQYVGILTIELFAVRQGQGSEVRLVVNEMAPRVHNSGHWTIEGAETSQFENHLRAIAGLPLGSTAARGFSAMRNIIGTFPDTAAVLNIPGVHLHLYGKSARAGRKLGHVTVCANSRGDLRDRLNMLAALLPLE